MLREDRNGLPRRFVVVSKLDVRCWHSSGTLKWMEGALRTVSLRVVVIGSAGSGKTTFSRALSTQTGVPVVHLDAHCWRPGWVKPSEDEWRERQRDLLSGDAWIADGNYPETLDLRLERAQSVVFLDTPWWTCAGRAFVRGLRRPVGWGPPEGCSDSATRRLREEWGLVMAICRSRASEPERTRALLRRLGGRQTVHVLSSRKAARAFLGNLGAD